MRQILKVLLLVLSFSIPASAEMKIFPKWELKKCPEQTFACYDFSTTQKILKIDLDMQLKLEKLSLLEISVSSLQDANGKLKKVVELYQNSVNSLEKRLQEKQLVLEKTTKDLIAAEKASVWKALPWIIVAVVVVSAGTFYLGYSLR